MFKIKKALSVILTVFMAVSALSALGTVAFAEDTLQVVYWNADSSRIILDFSNEVDVEELSSALLLRRNGTEIPFDVTAKPRTTDETNTLTADTAYTYIVVPEDGMTFDELYDVEISSELTAYDGTSMPQEGFRKVFVVDKIFKDDLKHTQTRLRYGHPRVPILCR